MIAEKEKEARLVKSRKAKRLEEIETGPEGQKDEPIPEENCQHGDPNEAAGQHHNRVQPDGAVQEHGRCVMYN